MLVGEEDMVHEKDNDYESQGELKVSVGSVFSDKYPVWKCPECVYLNRSVDTFFELCNGCKADHTLDWDEYILRAPDMDEAGKRDAKAGTKLREGIKMAVKDTVKPLEIKYEPPPVDMVTINGIRYTGEFFRLIAFPNPNFVYSFKRGEDNTVIIHRHGTKKELGIC